MNKNKILSGGGKNLIGGGKWGRRGREVGEKGGGEVGGKGEGTGNGVPPCPPPPNCFANLLTIIQRIYSLVPIFFI